ncbi:MAG: hypothetical protein H0W40_13700 [Methylibium sp.]|uniref:sensor histidine kinase n=1 Tax=Methylibium sp. TaxID=2067992 RepID=UPI0017E4988F|nr:ATP-binding protein [Methylibium sp.]MBA3598411.1 hypothetical protein [Methylibium sp.]
MDELISNALKYSRRNPQRRITIGGAVNDGELIYTVADNGVGFDAAKAAQLFTAFTRLHSEPEFEGIGIGLASVKRIVQRHKGRVWANGEVGRGATFHFALPGAHAAAAWAALGRTYLHVPTASVAHLLEGGSGTCAA